jgi:hypothetical protein
MILAAGICLAATATQAQNWMYQSGPGGTPPLLYGDPYSNLYGRNTSNWPPPSPVFETPTLPTVPHIQSYVPTSSYQPPVYLPPTMPGYR